MKKFVKTALLIAVICCVLGGALLVIGLGNGGLEELSKTDINSSTGTVSNIKKHTLEKEKLPEFTEIEADLSYADFKILPSEDGSCYLSYAIYDNKKSEPIYYEVKNNILHLKESETSDSFFQIDYSSILHMGRQSTDNFENSVTLYLPAEKLLESAAIALDSGDCSMDSFQTKQLDLEMNYGDLNIKDSTINQVKLSLGDGDMQANHLTMTNPDITVSYGELNLTDSTLQNAVIQLSDGDFNADRTTFLGQTTGQLEYGDASINLTEEQKASLGLQLSTDYGEISVSQGITGALSAQDNEDYQRFERAGSNPEETFTLRNSDGDITLR